jgi:hypothetical protein
LLGESRWRRAKGDAVSLVIGSKPELCAELGWQRSASEKLRKCFNSQKSCQGDEDDLKRAEGSTLEPSLCIIIARKFSVLFRCSVPSLARPALKPSSGVFLMRV